MPKKKHQSSRTRRRRRQRIRHNLLILLALALLLWLAWAWFLRVGSPGAAWITDVMATPSPVPTAPPTPTPSPTPSPTPTPVPTPTPSPTPVPTPTPSPSPTPSPTPVPTPEPTPVDLELPYYIEVDRGMQVVRVFTIGEDGEYSLLVRQMICSTDHFERKPPDGLYAMDGQKIRWLTTLVEDTYAQYATRIVAKILFHSVPYSRIAEDTLKPQDYAQLGQNVSAGCVRLLCADAKWIYDNVPAGTPVRFMTSERDDALLAELAPPALASGDWDPTDPDEDNPDYDPSYVKPEVTPALGVTPAPTEPWTPDFYE